MYFGKYFFKNYKNFINKLNLIIFQKIHKLVSNIYPDKKL